MNLSVDLEAAREVIGEKLTPAEWHVFLRLAVGKNDSEIARERGIRQQAVNHTMRRILEKLDLNNRMELAAYAALMGITRSERELSR